MNNNSEFIKSIHESIINLNEKIQKPTVKPILPLPNSQPLFSGKTNENIILWFTVTENNFRLSNIPPDSYVAYTLSYLRDLALQTHRSIATITPNITWDQLKTQFTAEFSDPNANLALLQKLYKLKQTGDLDSYVEQFLFLMNQTRDVSVYTQILLLTENLNPYLAQEVKYRQPTILQAAFDIAKFYVSTHSGMTSNSTASLNYTATKQHHQWCSFHRVKTHDTSECRRNKPSSGNSKLQTIAS
jgi:hypothetical protein